MRPVLRKRLLPGITMVFAARAIGDFDHVGFFKSERDSPFARRDTNLYSPMDLAISPLAGYLAFICIKPPY